MLLELSLNSWLELGKIAGLAGLSIGLILIIFRKIIARNIFSSLTKKQSYNILKLIIILAFTSGVFGIFAWTYLQNNQANMNGGNQMEDSSDKSAIVEGGIEKDSNTSSLSRDDPDKGEETQINHNRSSEASTAEDNSRGTVTVMYTGDNWGCNLLIDINIGGIKFFPTSNLYTVSGVPLGTQSYSIIGSIHCPLIGNCDAFGAGEIEVSNNSVFYVRWQNTGGSDCTVLLTR